MKVEIEGDTLIGISDLDFGMNFLDILPKNITKIGAHAFQDCPYFTEIIIPDYIEEIGEEAFNHNVLLKRVIIDPKVQIIRARAFKNCRNLESISYGSETRFGFKTFEGDNKITKIIEDGIEKRAFYFQSDNQYAITTLNQELSTNEYQVFVGKFSARSYFPIENFIQEDMNQYFVVITKDQTEHFWFSYDLELAKIGARWAASGLGAAEFFGQPFTDESVLNIEEFSLLIGACNIGEKLWNILGAIYGLQGDHYKIKDIKYILHNEWPELEDRFNTLLKKQYEDFNYLDMKNAITPEDFIAHVRKIVKEYNLALVEVEEKNNK